MSPGRCGMAWNSMRASSQEGIALVAVLWVLVMLSIVAASLCLEVRTRALIARNTADNAAARASADAGIQRAILDLIAGRHVSETPYDWRFANHFVRISVRDEASKIDVNMAPPALLAALFNSVGVDSYRAQSLADAIADFRDADNFTHPHGAEEAEYKTAGLHWGPKNAPFESLEELQQVLGMTPDTYKLVAPDLTIYTISGGTNMVSKRVVEPCTKRV